MSIRGGAARAWLVAGTAAALSELNPLIRAHERVRPVRVVETPGGVPPARRLLSWWREHRSGVAAALLVGSARHSPRTALPGLFLEDERGGQVPAGWLPGGDCHLGRYAEAAAAILERDAGGLPVGPLVLLGQRQERSIRLATHIAAELARPAPPGQAPLATFQWTGERLMGRDLVPALRCGPGMAMYFGHGLPMGWMGYGGIHAERLSALRLENGAPLGAILSLTCHVAGRIKQARSFCESVVLEGLCAAALGATRRTLNVHNEHLGWSLCRTAWHTGARTLGELLLAANPPRQWISSYRILGDPLAPLVGAAGAAQRAREVFAPAPDEPLPPLQAQDFTVIQRASGLTNSI